MAAGSIVIDLLMKTGSFETDTKRAEKRLKELEKAAIDFGKKAGLAFVAAATAAAYFVKSAIDAADEASKAAMAAGLTTESYTALAYAADLSGVSQDELTKAMGKISKAAVEAANGGKEAAASFKKLGIDVEDASGRVKDADVLFAEIADGLNQMERGSEKTALQLFLLGKGGATLAPLLALGSDGLAKLRKEAEAAGVVLDTKTGQAAEEFNDTITRMDYAVRGASLTLARELLPAFQAVAYQAFEATKIIAAGGGFREFAQDTAIYISNVIDRIRVLVLAVQALTGMVRSLGAEFKLAFDIAIITGGYGKEQNLEATLARLGDALEKRNAKVRASNQTYIDFLTADAGKFRKITEEAFAIAGTRGLGNQLGLGSRLLNPPPTPPKMPALSGGVGSASKDAVDKAAQYLETLRKQLEGTQNLTLAEKVLADIRSGSLGKLSETEGKGKELIDLAREIEATKEMQRLAQERSDTRKQEYDEINAFAERTKEADASRLGTLLSGTSGAQVKSVTEDIKFLNEQFSKGAIEDVNQWAEAVTQATGRLKQSGEEMDSFSKQMAENVQSFLGGAFAEAMDGNFKNIGKSFTSMLYRMVAEALAADLARRIFGSASGGTGDGWIGTAFAFAKSMFGGGKAGGGDVMPGREYWVGENGPERFRPRSMGTIIPASTGSQKNVTNNLNVNVTAQQGVSRPSAMQQGEAIGRGIQLAMLRNG